MNKSIVVPFPFHCRELWVPNKISNRIQSTEMTFFREAKVCTKLDNIRK